MNIDDPRAVMGKSEGTAFCGECRYSVTVPNREWHFECGPYEIGHKLASQGLAVECHHPK